MSDEIWKLGVCETALSIREGNYTCSEVVGAAVERLHKINPKLNAVSVDLSQEALEQASEADRKLQKNSDLGPLFGVPITLIKNRWRAPIALVSLWFAIYTSMHNQNHPRCPYQKKYLSHYY